MDENLSLTACARRGRVLAKLCGLVNSVEPYVVFWMVDGESWGFCRTKPRRPLDWSQLRNPRHCMNNRTLERKQQDLYGYDLGCRM